MTEHSIFNETFDEVRFIDVDDPKFVNVKNLFPGHFRSLTDALRVHTTDFYKYF